MSVTDLDRQGSGLDWNEMMFNDVPPRDVNAIKLLPSGVQANIHHWQDECSGVDWLDVGNNAKELKL